MSNKTVNKKNTVSFSKISHIQQIIMLIKSNKQQAYKLQTQTPSLMETNFTYQFVFSETFAYLMRRQSEHKASLSQES